MFLPVHNWQSTYFANVNSDDVLDRGALARFIDSGLEFIHVIHRVDASALRAPHGSMPTRSASNSSTSTNDNDDDDDDDDDDADHAAATDVPGARERDLARHRQFANDFRDHYDARV